jgi:hypothetical protein
MSNKYKNLIFTKHAAERIGDRSITKDKIWQTINNPDKVLKKNHGSKKFIKTISDRKFHVVATYLTKEKSYLVISAWVRGEDDKQSIIWTLITLPFKIIFWIIKYLFSTN